MAQGLAPKTWWTAGRCITRTASRQARAPITSTCTGTSYTSTQPPPPVGGGGGTTRPPSATLASPTRRRGPTLTSTLPTITLQSICASARYSYASTGTDTCNSLARFARKLCVAVCADEQAVPDRKVSPLEISRRRQLCHGRARQCAQGASCSIGYVRPTATLHAHAHMERSGATSLRHVYICFQNVQAQPACGRTTSRSRRALKTDH